MGRGSGSAALFVGILGGAFLYGAVRAARARAASLPDPGWPPLPVAPGSGDQGAGRDHHEADDAPAGPGGAPAPSTATWAAALAPGCAAHGVQLQYALKWVDMESGGNPCAVGYPPARGPDGCPREIGIAQFYNPDDLNALGLSGSRLRAYCVPGDQHVTTFKGKQVRGFSQEQSRPLTADEVREQAAGAVGLIAKSIASANRDLRGVGAGAGWSPTRRDFWRLVKLQHGLPEASSAGLALVTKRLGRPPASWAEFRAGLGAVKFGATTEAKYRALLPSILDNAEECAGAFAEGAVS